jgi:hypothetical protein
MLSYLLNLGNVVMLPKLTTNLSDYQIARSRASLSTGKKRHFPKLIFERANCYDQTGLKASLIGSID